MRASQTKAVTISILSLFIAYVTLITLARKIFPNAFIWAEEDRENSRWIRTSHWWLDRKACRWMNFCGVAHLGADHRSLQRGNNPQTPEPIYNRTEIRSAWKDGESRPGEWTEAERNLRTIPDYVCEYAPLVHLFSGEQYWPGDIAEHLIHTTPRWNYSAVPSRWQQLGLSDLDKLNEWEQGKDTFLTSNVKNSPVWLQSAWNMPYSGPVSEIYVSEESSKSSENCNLNNGQNVFSNNKQAPLGNNFRSRRSAGADLGENRGIAENPASSRAKAGRSNAPAILIVLDKGQGIVDAFWFYFYSFNLGNSFLDIGFGNHIGDWEHSLVRFKHGKPVAVFVSEHSFGEAYTYDAVEKRHQRPVIYSASGSHAMYATPGIHPYILPWNLLHDITDRGPLWDPLQNFQAYTYDQTNDILRSSNLTPHAPVEWFYFNGHWGDKFYNLGDPRQYRLAGQYHYVNGPLGPRFKNLGRKQLCQGPESEPCKVQKSLPKTSRYRR